MSRVLPISSLLLVILFKFENCAQSPQMLTNGVSPASGVVGIVDNFQTSPLQFVANPQLVAQSPSSGSMAAVKVQGLCVGGAEHQSIDYQVFDMRSTPQLISTGQVPCEYGGFELPVNNLAFSNCEDRYEVRAARSNDPSQFSTTMLQLDCVSQKATTN